LAPTLKRLEGRHLVRYLVVGGSAYVFEMTCLFVLKNRLGVSDLKSVAISFWLGLGFAFIAQKLLTFRNKANNLKALSKQMVKYMLLVLWNYVFTLMVVNLLSDSLSVIILRTLVILLVTTWNYKIYSYIFKYENKKVDATVN
jgi:putative flippase GtrA